jgi:hypothetical protein
VSDVSWWMTLAALLGAPLAMLVCARRRAWLGFVAGGAAWIVAVGLKLWIDPPLQAWLLPGVVTTSLALGLASSLAELGLAAPILSRCVRTVDAVAVGAGAGVFELCCALFAGWSEMRETLGTDAHVSLCPASFGWGFLVERGLTLAGHVSSRLLLFAAFRARRIPLALAAVALFAAVDSAATYFVIRGVDLTEGGAQAGFLGGVAAVTAVEVALALLGLRRIARASSAAAPATTA